MHPILEFFLHLDRHLGQIIQQFGPASYGILWGVIFVETGFVVTPFLPGDSLLFAAGLFARPEQDAFSLVVLLTILPVASFLGDMLNFHIGKYFGSRFVREDGKGLIKAHHLAKTRAFFERHGGKAIILGRFVPIVRTIAPFVAGMEGMDLKKFAGLSAMAGIIWVWVCVWAGYLLGAIPAVRQHFDLAILVIVFLSAVAIGVEIWRDNHRRAKQAIAEPEIKPVVQEN